MKKLISELYTSSSHGSYNAIMALLPNPDEVLRKRGSASAAYAKVLLDPRVTATVGSRKAGVKKLLWETQADNGMYKAFADDYLSALDMPYIINKILDATQYGMQPLEVIWGRDGAKIIPIDVIDKPAEWFTFSATRELRFKAKGKQHGEPIPSKKILLPRHEHSYINPYGTPLLSQCFWPVAMKRGVLPVFMNYIERFGSSHLIGKLPNNATQEEYETLADALEKLIDDAIAVIPENSNIEIVDNGSKSSTDTLFNNFLNYADQDITLIQLGQTLTTDSAGKGSYALGKVHDGVRQDIIDSDAALVEKTINTLIGWANEINFGTSKNAPKFILYTADDVDSELAKRDQILASTGQIRFTKEYFVKNYGFAESDIETIE